MFLKQTKNSDYADK
ncbi:TPA: 23S rRNA methyltransferase attenuation leader peptide [Enterococcus faecium]|nr:23S rRNA methyltransferase attenuation leader peptide [Enterococcus faecium]HAQ6742556.1 23S rRNA methyltransferase attenuation leader peptide [Enterococcus faecium]